MHYRKRPIHFPPKQRIGHPTILFVTVCTKNRKWLLARNKVHTLLKSAWTTNPAWLVGWYVIMPDHIHFFCAPNAGQATGLEKWIQFWKSVVSRNWPWPEEQPVWQRGFWDRQLRTWESYEEKWHYVLLNPVRKGLVSAPEEWPFAGELNLLRW